MTKSSVQRNLVNEITWRRSHAHGDAGQGAKHFGRVTEAVLIYGKSEESKWHPQYRPYTDEIVKRDYKYVDEDTGESYRLAPVDGPGGASKGNPFYEFLGVSGYWRFSEQRMQELHEQGEIVLSSTGKSLSRKLYLRDAKGTPVPDLWDDVNRISPTSKERLGFPTQKPEALLERIVATSTDEGDLVADFFCGSGTALAVAEKMGRRWIGADLSRFAIHTTRKRLLEIPDCRPFEVQNLGRYERRYWQGVNAGEAIWEYYTFLLELYRARPVSGFTHLHGERGGRMIHVGATDAPVTLDELRLTLEECQANGLTEVDVLGWEWEMSLNPAGKDELAHEFQVDVRLVNIPREVMDKRAVDAGDVHFFELSVTEVQAHVDTLAVEVELAGFLPAVDDYMLDKVGDKVSQWSDWVDYWSVDFEFDGGIFVNQWQTYRTRRDPKLVLRSDPHAFEKPGDFRVVVKVIDIFGNDTTHELTVSV